MGTGETGATGADGAKGERGVEGPEGAEGARGTRGVRGVRGSSGGPEGPRGPEGVEGEHGAPGERGAPGVAGVPGVAGGPGLRGPAGREPARRLVPLLIAMLVVFMLIAGTASMVALVSRSDIEDANESRRVSRGLICALEKGVIDTGEKTITGELFGRPPDPERQRAGRIYRERVALAAAGEARKLGIEPFPGLRRGGTLDCSEFQRLGGGD